MNCNKTQYSSSQQKKLKIIDKWRKEVCSLSYDQALKALDLLLEELQNDNVPVENLQRHYIQGQIYLNHCENLLKNVEQEVIELPPETLQ